MKRCIIDIESSGLLENMIDYSSFPYKLNQTAKLWCVVIRDYDTNEIFSAVKEEITAEWMEKTLLPYEQIIFHNGIKFDIVALKLFGVVDYTIGYLNEMDTLFGREVRFIDTLILSRIVNPDRLGGHGLHAWGLRTNNLKIGFRELCIEDGIIEKSSPKGSEFLQYSPRMLDYCIGDTSTNASAYTEIIKELQGYDGWKQAIRQEHKLADLAVRRENLGFWFDKKLALELLEDLTVKMQNLTDSVNPNLPLRPLKAIELSKYTPPKQQLKADGSYTASFIRFTESLGGVLKDGAYHLDGQLYQIPILEPLRTNVRATIDDLDAVKMHLLDLGWNPTEWKERDLTKDSKKINLTYEKRIKALDRWFKETMEGKYKKERLKFLKEKETTVYEKLKKRLKEDKPVRVPTSPSIRVGVEKEICPNLIEIGDKVGFAKDVADYLTYKHRKSSIAGGDIDEMDFDTEVPNTGFLKMYREADGRIPTPAIEIGAATHRYKHIGVANIARASSIYGKEMRSLFGAGKDFIQLGFDFASLEARIQGSFVYNYTDGKQLAETLLAVKPNDIHSVNALKMGIPRDQAKSLTYAIIYGAQAAKIAKMLSISLDEAKVIYDDFWLAVPALKELKEALEKEWLQNDKKFIRGVDGRKINIRSQHSILNALFQSSGVICTKYTTVLLMQYLEEKGYCIDPFKGRPDVCNMIDYHDESQFAINPKLVNFLQFKTEEEAKEFIKDLDFPEQISAIAQGKTWYVTLPNDVSIGIDRAIKQVDKLMNLNINLGFDWVVGKNWYGCH